MIKAYAAHEAGGKFSPFEFDPGSLGYQEVEIDVEHCGICHSDLSMLDNEWGLSQYPLVAGHEIVGSLYLATSMLNCNCQWFKSLLKGMPPAMILWLIVKVSRFLLIP